MENANGLVLVDQHAAHERVLFEELRRRMEQQGVPTQKLLLPQTFDVPPRDADWIEQNLSVLQKMGIGIESFGPDTFKIDSLPSFLDVSDAAQFMRKVIDDLKSAGNNASAMRLGEEMIAKTVCRHAVKANDPLRYPEVEKLIRDLLDCDLPLLLSARAANNDPDFASRTGKKVWPQGLIVAPSDHRSVVWISIDPECLPFRMQAGLICRGEENRGHY